LFVDGTLGSVAIVKRSLKHQRDVRSWYDRDAEALELATTKVLEHFGARFRAVHGNFKEIASI